MSFSVQPEKRKRKNANEADDDVLEIGVDDTENCVCSCSCQKCNSSTVVAVSRCTRPKLEFVHMQVESHPRRFRFLPDIIMDVFLFLHIDIIFRLNVANRFLLKAAQNNPAFASLSSSEPRQAAQIYINKYGFKVSNAITMPTSSDDWKVVPAPMMPIPKEIEAFRSIQISFPLVSQRNHSINFEQVKEFMSAAASTGLLRGHVLKVGSCYIDDQPLNQTDQHRQERQRTFELFECFNQKRHQRFYVISISRYYHASAQFFQLASICRSTHMRIGCSSFGGSFASLIEWLQYQDDSMKEKTEQDGNCDDSDSDDRTYRTTERILLIRNDRYEPSSNMISDFLVRTTSMFMCSVSPASFVVVFESTQQTTLPNLSLINDITGELLVFGSNYDDHTAIVQIPQQQHQQANNNANLNNNNNGGNASNGNGNNLVTFRLFLRRRPAFGPLRHVDMTPFDRAMSAPSNRYYRQPQQQAAAANQPQHPAILINENNYIDF